MTKPRDFLRIKVPLLLGYRLLEQGAPKVSVTTDVAVGGVRFTTREPIESGARLQIQIQVPWHSKPIETVAHVVRSARIPNSAAFEVATKFERLDKPTAEEIAKIIHLVQSELYLHKLIK